MDFAIGFAVKARDKDNNNKNITVPVLVSGDTHHYSRYSAAEDGTQFITSGGGGAFLHPTHQLDNDVRLVWVGEDRNLSLKTNPSKAHGQIDTEACYPSKAASRQLLRNNFRFALNNKDFSVLMGAIYWLAAVIIILFNHPDIYLLVAGVFAWAIIGYTKKQEKARIDWFFWNSPKKPVAKTEAKKNEARQKQEKEDKEKVKSRVVLTTSVIHVGAHLLVIFLATNLFNFINAAVFGFSSYWLCVWLWLGVLAIEMGLVGFFVGSSIFGLNMLITSDRYRMNTNDSFSAFRFEGYKNFLRFHFKGEELEIYAVGLDQVPTREHWIPNPAHEKDPHAPVFVPRERLQPHLIEKIEI